MIYLFLAIQAVSAEELRPVIFVHGLGGSGGQFESQALRFTSNGYPAEYIKVFEYDTITWGLVMETDLALSGLSSVLGINLTKLLDEKIINKILEEPREEVMAKVFGRLDRLIDETLAESGADKVDLVGHSMGTFLLMEYVKSSPERASKVAHLILLDGIWGVDAPEGIPTLAIFGNLKSLPALEFPEGREVHGATNVYFNNMTHVQLCTAAPTFAEMYKFINGVKPDTTDILHQSGEYVKVKGKFVAFATNAKVSGWLRVYPIDENGKRLRWFPVKIIRLWDGSFEMTLKKGQRYEFVLIKDFNYMVYHYYRAPFVRDDLWVRFLASTPPADVELLITPERLSPNAKNAVGLLLVRYKEMLGEYDVDIGGVDEVYVNGINICTAKICPISKAVNGLWVFDRFADGKSNLEKKVLRFSPLPFMSAADLFVPADGVVKLTVKSRSGGMESFTVPAWPASRHSVIVQFSDTI